MDSGSACSLALRAMVNRGTPLIRLLMMRRAWQARPSAQRL